MSKDAGPLKRGKLPGEATPRAFMARFHEWQSSLLLNEHLRGRLPVGNSLLTSEEVNGTLMVRT